MRRVGWALIAALAVGCSCWLLANWWTSIWPNLAASVIWGTPALVLHHVLIRRHVDRRHEERRQEAHARHLEQRAQLAAVAAKVGELHDFHVRGILPERELRPWLHKDDAEPAPPAA